MEKSRRYVLRTSILVVWAITGGLYHCVLFEVQEKNLKNVT